MYAVYPSTILYDGFVHSRVGSIIITEYGNNCRIYGLPRTDWQTTDSTGE